MALFSALGVAAFLGIEAGFIATATAFALNLAVGTAASIGLSYASKAISGEQTSTSVKALGVETKLQGGGAVPRSFGLGHHVTGGSLVWANAHGDNLYDTPNALLTQIIALSDLPGEQLRAVWCNGVKVTLAEGDADYQNLVPGDYGYAVPEFTRPHNGEGAPVSHLWFRYYDGSQTGWDVFTASYAASAERPYETTRVGKGICYIAITAYMDENLWQGIPSFKFELSGIPLYDPSKDTSVGGSGSQRFNDTATWGGDGDDFPVVQIYNVLRGISYDGDWFYGLQNTSSARLPVSNWITQIAKCRATVTGASGPEATYRAGSHIDIDVQPASTIEGLLTACQGKISEIGGFYKIRVGAPDSISFTFTDDDIISNETQTFEPFYALSQSINGIQGRHPDPSQGWGDATMPPLYRTDLEARDGNRRLMANPNFACVPYPEQAQRLQKSAIEEAQRARGHTLTLPPAYWTVEPGDIGGFTSERNGYDLKLFRVDGATDKTNLDIMLVLREVDPADYDWNRTTDLQAVTSGSTFSPLPDAQGVTGWDAQPYTIEDADGLIGRPAILISWDTSQPGIVGIQYEIRLQETLTVMHRGFARRYVAGNQIIAEGILPLEVYEARGQFVPSFPRDMEWSDWVEVTTPDVRFSINDLIDGLQEKVTTALDSVGALATRLNAVLTTIQLNDMSRNWLDKKELRRELSSVSGTATAQITELFQVTTDLDAALAQTTLDLTAEIDDANASIEITNTALSDLTQSVADQKQTFEARFGDVEGSITTEIQTRSTADGALATSISNLTTQTNNSFASVNDQFLAQADINSSFSGQLTSFSTTLGGHTASLSILASSVNGTSITLGLVGTIDGVTGGLVLTGMKNASGVVYNLVLKGDLLIDGSVSAVKISVANLAAIKANLGTVTAGAMQSPDNKFLVDLTNKKIVISD